MNPNLAKLHPYPFEKLRQLFAGVTPNPNLREIRLSIGEPQHETPPFIKEALTAGLSGLANYPTTLGLPALRQAIAAWLQRRYALDGVDPEREIIPVNGSREALFAFTQALIDPTAKALNGEAPLVVSPNPFYQIYEGATYLAGADLRFLNTLPENDYAFDFDSLSDAEWRRVQLMFVCSPGNPTGKVLNLEDWKRLFALSDKYGFVIASDECYSEIFFDEAKPPLGGLPHGHFRAGRIMPPVDAAKGGIVNALQAKLQPDLGKAAVFRAANALFAPIVSTGISRIVVSTIRGAHTGVYLAGGKHIQLARAEAVRARAYGNAKAARQGRHLLEQKLQAFRGAIRIGVGLQIGHKGPVGVSGAIFFKPRPPLLLKRKTAYAQAGARTRGVAERAAPARKRTVPVGTGRARVKWNFLHPCTVFTTKIHGQSMPTQHVYKP